MARLHIRLGNGRTGTLELDDFSRIQHEDFYDYEEVRKIWVGNYEFIAVAENGASIYEPVWKCVRITWLNGKKMRIQYQENIAYSDINNGWTL